MKYYYYKVRNDLSVSTLTKIIEELYAITNFGYQIRIRSMGINDLRIIMNTIPSQPINRGILEEIRAAMSVMPPHYLKTMEGEE